MKNIIIFGAGKIGRKVCEEVLLIGIDRNTEFYYFDSDPKKQGTYINHIFVLPYDSLIQKINSENCEIILATDYWRELFAVCQTLKIDDKIIGIFNSFSFNSNPYFRKMYGQEAEDIYLQEIFEMKYGSNYKGFYIDIGAHHPYRFSNTQWAYRRGWTGINIEPNEELIRLFGRVRSKDININCGIGKEEKIMKYYKFEEPALNTFDEKEFYGRRIPSEITSVPVRRIDSVLNEYNINKIDFMNIDVEGFEMNVLQSNDWNKYKPDFILVEQKNMPINKLLRNEIYCYLNDFGYKCEWKSRRTVIYYV